MPVRLLTHILETDQDGRVETYVRKWIVGAWNFTGPPHTVWISVHTMGSTEVARCDSLEEAQDEAQRIRRWLREGE